MFSHIILIMHNSLYPEQTSISPLDYEGQRNFVLFYQKEI